MAILPDATTYYTCYADPSKSMKLTLSTLTPGQRRTLTIPDESGTVALTSHTHVINIDGGVP